MTVEGFMTVEGLSLPYVRPETATVAARSSYKKLHVFFYRSLLNYFIGHS